MPPVLNRFARARARWRHLGGMQARCAGGGCGRGCAAQSGRIGFDHQPVRGSRSWLRADRRSSQIQPDAVARSIPGKSASCLPSVKQCATDRRRAAKFAIRPEVAGHSLGRKPGWSHHRHSAPRKAAIALRVARSCGITSRIHRLHDARALAARTLLEHPGRLRRMVGMEHGIANSGWRMMQVGLPRGCCPLVNLRS